MSKTLLVGQSINLHSVYIMKNPATGDRAAKIVKTGMPVRYVPIDLLGLAAGKDAWMRDIQYKCSDCKTKHKASEMECQLCPTCYEKAEKENEEANA